MNLGSSSKISEAIERWRTSFGRGEDGQAAASSLRSLLWGPLEKSLDKIDVVLISPDGLLAQLPWGALPGALKDTYLIEERSFCIIPVPQFLPEWLEHAPASRPPEGLLLAGDIDYGSDPGDNSVFVASRQAVIRSQRNGRLMKFDPLAAAQPEMASIKQRYERAAKNARQKPNAYTLELDGATESAFCEQAQRYPWLHVITHGYFAPSQLKSLVQRGGDPVPPSGAPESEQNLYVHPGLLSGLAFAGANREHQEGKDDGILSALDVSGLDMSHVDTIVLSACETGLGEVAGGEGLLGLQRAFEVAGAKTCVASLWKVPDSSTSRMMQRFYENLWDKKMGKLEALREAQIWMLRDKGNRGLQSIDHPADPSSLPPYYWAAFVLSGDWR